MSEKQRKQQRRWTNNIELGTTNAIATANANHGPINSNLSQWDRLFPPEGGCYGSHTMWTVTKGSGRDGHEGDQAITKGVLLQMRPQQPVLIPIIGRLASIYAIGQSVPDR